MFTFHVFLVLVDYERIAKRLAFLLGVGLSSVGDNADALDRSKPAKLALNVLGIGLVVKSAHEEGAKRVATNLGVLGRFELGREALVVHILVVFLLL